MMQKEDSLTHTHKLSNGNQYDVSPAQSRRRQVLKCRSIRHVLNERSEAHSAVVNEERTFCCVATDDAAAVARVGVGVKIACRTPFRKHPFQRRFNRATN